MIQEFRDFIFRGNALALAIGVMVAGAFQKVVDAVIKWMIGPIIGALTGGIGWEGLLATQLGSNKDNIFSIGGVIGAIVSFLITMLVLFIIAKSFAKDALKKG